MPIRRVQISGLSASSLPSDALRVVQAVFPHAGVREVWSDGHSDNWQISSESDVPKAPKSCTIMQQRYTVKPLHTAAAKPRGYPAVVLSKLPGRTSPEDVAAFLGPKLRQLLTEPLDIKLNASTGGKDLVDAVIRTPDDVVAYQIVQSKRQTPFVSMLDDSVVIADAGLTVRTE